MIENMDIQASYCQERQRLPAKSPHSKRWIGWVSSEMP